MFSFTAISPTKVIRRRKNPKLFTLTTGDYRLEVELVTFQIPLISSNFSVDDFDEEDDPDNDLIF